MWRVEVAEAGRAPLPPVDLAGDELEIGSGERSAVRLPAQAARPRHLVVRKLSDAPLTVAWVAEHGLTLQGAPRHAGESGQAQAPLVVQLGSYRLTITAAPAGSRVTAPARTESLARELLRGILGGAAPRLVVERGPEVGSSRVLGPPETSLTIGRGDEADWVILDEDLSRVHAQLVSTWDGVVVTDMGSKNGTRVDGSLLSPGEPGRVLRDGARLALGAITLRFDDEADRRYKALDVEGDAPLAEPTPPRPRPAGALWVMALGAIVALLALGAIAYLLFAG